MGAVIGVKQQLPEPFSVQIQKPVIAFSAPLPAQEISRDRISVSLVDFVERRFVPEYAMQRRKAGRAHLHAILKHILSPERMDKAFHVDLRRHRSGTRLTHDPGWPYMDAFPLAEITPDAIQALLSASMKLGHSAQTVNHIRNVIGLIFSHAILCGEYHGISPVSEVPALTIVPRQVFTLTTTELKRAMELMRYPERHIALLALLTDMSVAEICGLQWKHVNFSNEFQLLGREQLPPRTLAVRMQSYRGEYCSVKGSRSRLMPLPEPLFSVLQELAFRMEFRSGEDFVLASRTGGPVNPDNIAGRRLKAVGKNLSQPSISWKVFQRTGLALRKQFGRQAPNEIERVLSVRR